MTKQISAIERLQSLPRVFRGSDLTVRFQWTSKRASHYLFLWKGRGLVDGLGGHSDVFANLLIDRHPDWDTALKMAMPSAVVIGIEALRQAGWTTQIPRVPTIAVDGTQPVYSTPHFEVSRRDPVWFAAMRAVLKSTADALPCLPPAWALADMLHQGGWEGSGLGPDDIDWSEVTERDEKHWKLACAALGLEMGDLSSLVDAHTAASMRA